MSRILQLISLLLIPYSKCFLVSFLQVGDSTAAMIVVLLLFMFPAKMDFRYMFSEDEERRPKAASSGLITWRFVNQKMHWSLIFLMGGGFALADGIKNSGMGDLTAEKLSVIVDLPPVQILIICSLLAMVVTQFTSNAAVANILLPIIANIARVSILSLFVVTIFVFIFVES